MIVQRKQFFNATEYEVNEFLANIDAENIVSTHFDVHEYADGAGEWTTIFYKVEEAPQS
ncbi:hypothetical protein ACFSR7_35885 [Cohnella sp. GCM10020058]|uniref:hypothetical protein n=1 Tax=Cohnella sp. GCM10020058 TaxID=3317330 RepID=UPI00363F2AF8